MPACNAPLVISLVIRLKNDDTPLHRITSVYGEEIKGFKTFKYDKPFEMKMGGSIEGMEIVYETWGELNHEKDNAILLHTGLSASSHAKSHEVIVCHLLLSSLHITGRKVGLWLHCHSLSLSPVSIVTQLLVMYAFSPMYQLCHCPSVIISYAMSHHCFTCHHHSSTHVTSHFQLVVIVDSYLFHCTSLRPSLFLPPPPPPPPPPQDNTSRGWWEPFIGPGAALNTDKYFVICTNVLGGCFGSR